MNTERDLLPALKTWLHEDAHEFGDRVLDSVLDQLDSNPQSSASWLGRRLLMNNKVVRYGLVAAAVVIIAVVAINLLPGSPAPGGEPSGPGATEPSLSPTASPSSSPLSSDPGADASSPAALPSCEPLFGCEPLPAGTYETAVFRPTLTFTVPAGGWTHEGDGASGFSLSQYSSRFGVLGVSVMSQRAIPVQDDCSGDREPGAGGTVQDWVAFLIGHPGLETTEPAPVALGGFDGMQLDVKVAAGWTLTCPESEGPAVVLIADSDFIDTAQVRFRILDVAGQTVIVYVDESDSSLGSLEERDAALQPLLDTFQFTP